jgi:hypothetical protein
MAPLLVLLSVLLVSCAAQSSWLRNGGRRKKGRRGEVGTGTVLHRLIETIYFCTPSLLVCKMGRPDASPLGEKNDYAQLYLLLPLASQSYSKHHGQPGRKTTSEHAAHMGSILALFPLGGV